MMSPHNRIVVEHVSKYFSSSPVAALDNISATIEPGEITGLVGPDGAGKTTLLRLMTGLMLPTEGSITITGINTRSHDPALFDKFSYMPQRFGLYEDLTVMENLVLYAKLRSLPTASQGPVFDKMLDFTNLAPFVNRRAGKLSGGMKQKLGLACALLTEPGVLLLDEPSVGVDPLSRRELWRMVSTIAKSGISIVWATSYLDEAEKCASVLLLNEGKLLYHGSPQSLTHEMKNFIFYTPVDNNNKRALLSEVLQQKGVVDAVIQGDQLRIMLKPDTTLSPALPLVPTPARFEDAFMSILEGKYIRQSLLTSHFHGKKEQTRVIQAMGLTKFFGDFRATHDIQFTVTRGEIFGLLGPNGAGKSTTFKMLCGLLQPTTGKALISGIDLRTASAKARGRLGYMAQKFSLYSNLSVKQNLDFFSGIYGLHKQERLVRIKQMYDMFELERYRDVNADQLPLGYKQRLALACAIMHEPDVLFLDEPTSGVDPLTRREFWVHINGMVQKGITIMVTTHFMDEAEYCDRIALIYQGENIALDTPEGLKNRIRSTQCPDPTLEEAFIALIEQHDKTTA